MDPPKITLGLLCALFVLMVGGFVVQWQTNTALWSAIEGLGADQVGAVTAGRSGNAGRDPMGGVRVRDSNETELGRLREEVSELSARTAALARLPGRAAESSSTPLNLSPASAWKNAGRSTPSAAAQTVYWATDSGDVNALAGAISLDPGAREKAEAILARMPDSVRAVYDTPEKLVALLLARETDIRAMQVLGENRAGDEALVNLRLLKDDGKTKDEGVQFRQALDGWRMNITGKVVEKIGKKLSDPGKKDGGKK